jgi:hypothetical protein
VRREVVQVPGQIKMKPVSTGSASLPTGKVRNGNNQSSTGANDAIQFLKRPLGMRQMFQHVPQDHCVKRVCFVSGIGKIGGNTNAGSRIGACSRFRRNLDTVRFMSEIEQSTQHHSASAADVEHP